MKRSMTRQQFVDKIPVVDAHDWEARTSDWTGWRIVKIPVVTRPKIPGWPYGKKYKVIYLDPPWRYRNVRTGGNHKSGASQKYRTMSLDELKALPIAEISDEPAVVIMWITWPFMNKIDEVLNAWGYRYYGLFADWMKTNGASPGLFMGMGFIARGNSEACIIGMRGRYPTSALRSRAISSAVLEPRGAHSAKPERVRFNIEALFGSVPRIELFARGPVAPGWDFWGDQAWRPVVPPLRLERVRFAMPNRWTFRIKGASGFSVARLLQEEQQPTGPALWVDPFAGMDGHKFADHTNDINKDRIATSHVDALQYLQGLRRRGRARFNGVIIDWPYTNGQYREHYREAGLPVDSAVFNARYQSQIKDVSAELVRPGGKAILFGYNSMGLGEGRGFRLVRQVNIAHGRMHHDTIITVEVKVRGLGRRR